GEVPTAAPHPPQNFTPGSFENPHEAQATASAEPHSAQNRRPALLVVPQRAQFIASPSPPAVLWSRCCRTHQTSAEGHSDAPHHLVVILAPLQAQHQLRNGRPCTASQGSRATCSSIAEENPAPPSH